MTFRKARLLDVDAVMALVQQRIDWMNDVGLHQWNETDYFGRYPRSYWEKNIDYFLVGEQEGKVVVAIALYTEDVRWTRDGEYIGNLQGEAFYLHHLVTDTAFPGAGVEMMHYVERYAREQNIPLLRLDSAVGNLALERYYTALGYTACGTCNDRLYHGILREKQII
ncbi:MAG: GNAT family N-acetyltransferase [Bacteroidales bacterium]|nr:GNAT family N-acetyltransferase [Bacteroidales bacterium]